LTKGEDPRATERSKLKGHFFYQPGRATANALKDMYYLMGLTVPDDLVEKYLERKKAEVLANPGRFLGLPEDAIPAGMPRAHVNDFSASPARLQELAQELSAYNGTPVEQVADRLQEELHGQGGHIAAEWLEKRPVTSGQIRRFYQETDAYLYELLIEGENPFRNEARYAMMEALHKIGARRVFEFGGGIGTDAIWFTRAGLQWTYYDLPGGQTFRFASWRFQKQQVPVTVVTRPSQSRENDAAISIEVFEHLPNLLGALRDINRALRPGGLLIFTESFGKTKRHPLHLSRTAIQGRFLNELMRAAGFEPVRRFGPEDWLYRTTKRRNPTSFDWLHAIVLIAGRVARKIPAKLWRALSQRSPVTHRSGS
jgi:SAM-dependent methyltransferase